MFSDLSNEWKVKNKEKGMDGDSQKSDLITSCVWSKNSFNSRFYIFLKNVFRLNRQFFKKYFREWRVQNHFRLSFYRVSGRFQKLTSHRFDQSRFLTTRRLVKNFMIYFSSVFSIQKMKKSDWRNFFGRLRKNIYQNFKDFYFLGLRYF